MGSRNVSIILFPHALKGQTRSDSIKINDVTYIITAKDEYDKPIMKSITILKQEFIFYAERFVELYQTVYCSIDFELTRVN